MATRSRIAIENEDGTVTSIYCHWDGYPENNGKILLEHYQDRKKTQKLIDLGSISYLAPDVEPGDGVVHSFEMPTTGIVVAYHRDRGEEHLFAEHKDSQDFFESDIEEYGYLLTKDGEWMIKEGYSRLPPQNLRDVMAKLLIR
jgi:hypothetical protein